MGEQTEKKLYLIFQSIHNVMLAEELLLQASIKIEMVPVPRDISSDCGMSLTCLADDLEKVKLSLKKAKFTTSVTIYKPEKDGQKPSFYNSFSL